MENTVKLFDFIKSSPSAYHAVQCVREALLGAGYTELSESDRFELTSGEGYFVTRGDSSIIAFRAMDDAKGFMITATHSDSPALRVKANGNKCAVYSTLDVERYGGLIYSSWLDRPLSVAGRAVIRTDSGIATRLVNIDRDLITIPSLAIHLNKSVNESNCLNPATDLLPLYSDAEGKGIISLVADELSVSAEDIISHDLFVYNRDEGRIIGEGGEYILCPRLDDLECVYAALTAFLTAEQSSAVPVLAVFDNEEVGSATKQGAASTFLADTLRAICGDGDYISMLGNSFMVSADNAHALHPNRPEMSDKANAPIMNRGPVIKFNSSQRYATDGVSFAVFKTVCERAGVKTQTYYNRADLPGGSTLGSISNTRVSIPTVDIGLAQLAMHSASETAGRYDLDEMVKALRAFYSSALIRTENGYDIK